MKTLFYSFVLLSILNFQFIPNLGAQNQFSISGKVFEFDNTPIENAKVFLSEDVFTFTNENGEYIFENLEGGLDYTIQVEKTDFEENRINALDFLNMGELVGFQGPGSIPHPIERFEQLKYDTDENFTISMFDNWYISNTIRRNFDFINIWGYGDAWKFYKPNFTPTDTFDETKLNSIIELKSLSTDSNLNNFYGVLSGDLVKTSDFQTVNTPVEIEIVDVDLCSDKILVPVKISSQKEVFMGQFSITYDSSLIRLINNNLNITGQTITPGNQKFLVLIGNQSEYNFDLEFEAKVPNISQTDIIVETDIENSFFLSEDEKILPLESKNGNIAYRSSSLFADIGSLDTTFTCPNEIFEVCVKPQGGVSPYTIQWEDGNTAFCNQYTNSKRIEFRIEDAMGCASHFNEEVTINQPSRLSLGPHLLIQPKPNASDGAIRILRVIGGTRPFEFEWSNGATTLSINDIPAGEYRLKVIDANGCTFSYLFELNDTTTSSTKTNELANSNIKITPNPSSIGQGILELETNQNQSGTIEIYDLSGRKLSVQNIETTSSNNKFTINNKFQKGIYLINIMLEKEGRKTLKWVIQ